MKKLILAISVLFCTAATMTSCNNGAYDADPNTNNGGTTNPINTGGNGGGNNGGSFNWTGTDPLSAKIDGTPYQATSGSASDLVGFLTIDAGASSPSTSFLLFFPSNTAAGNTVNFSGTAFATYTDAANTMYNGSPSGGGSGALKILENDATHVKGLFYGTLKSSGGATKTITEGYFNVKK